MLRRSLLFLLLASASPLCAQSSTFPAGFDATFGGHVTYHWGGAPGRALQIADRSNARPRAVRQIAFRRAGARAQTAASAGTINAEVVMAENPFSFLDLEFDKNQRFNLRVTLSANVNLPNWTTAQPNPNFDLVFKFRTVWIYTGRAALVWTIRYDQGPATHRVIDRAFGAIQSRRSGRSLGLGCSNNTRDFLRLDNSGDYSRETGMHMLVSAVGAPASAPSWLLIDSKVSQLNVGLCAPLRVLPTILLPMGNASLTGAISPKYVSFPYNKSVEGSTLATQWLFFDPSQSGLPFQLSGGYSAQMPVSTNTKGTASAYAWAPGRNAKQGTGDWWFFSGAPVMQVK